LEVGGRWRHHHLQQQHQDWKAAKKWSGGRNENSLEICSVFNAGYHYFYLIHANVLYWEKKLVHGGPQNDTDAISTELKLV